MLGLFEPGKHQIVDGLRAWAILLVLITHLIQAVPGISFVWGGMEILHPLFNGWIGVDLFFVLSGFLVGGQILKAVDAGTFSFKNFYLRRSFRILPAYFFCLLFFATIQIFWPDSSYSHNLASFLKNLFLMTDYFPANLGVPSWSLSIEEKFYVICPILFYLARSLPKDQKLKLLISIFSLALLFRFFIYRYFSLGPGADVSVVHEKIYFPFHCRMDSLAMGLIAALTVDVVLKYQDRDIISIFLRRIGALLVLPTLIIGSLSGGLFETTLQYTLLSLGFGMVLIGLLSCESQRKSFGVRFFSSKFWVPIARLSYAIYLTHLVIIHKASLWLNPTFNIAGFVKLGLIGIFCFSGALLLFLFVENPIHKWAREKFKTDL